MLQDFIFIVKNWIDRGHLGHFILQTRKTLARTFRIFIYDDELLCRMVESCFSQVIPYPKVLRS